MSTIASKNLYDLLGNDPEQDPEREPEPPTNVVDKPVQRSSKRNVGIEGQPNGTQRMATSGHGGVSNQSEQREDSARQDRHGNRNREDRGRGRGRGEGRGGRGYSGRFQRNHRDDRHDHSGIANHEKQVAHGWGDEKDGAAEWTDEKAGEVIANAEARDEAGFTADTSGADPAFTNGPWEEGEVGGDDAAAESEEKKKSYDDYLAEQAEKRLALGNGNLAVRKANEGTKQRFPEGTQVKREEENFFIGAADKARREKAQKEKNTLTLDGQYYAAPDPGDRGGRGRGRGGRGRGEFRGDRGGRGGRGGRGEFRGGRGDRGSSRGGFNATDQSAFPALGN